MNRPFLLRPLTAKELVELQKYLRSESTPSGLFRRYNLIWQLSAGFGLGEASQLAGLHYSNSHIWVKRFQRGGLEGLRTIPRSGRPRVYAKRSEEVVIQAATSRPADLGLEFTTWSLVKLEEYLRLKKGIKAISRETIRRILRRHGLRFLSGQTWCESNDPYFEQKKTRS